MKSSRTYLALVLLSFIFGQELKAQDPNCSSEYPANSIEGYTFKLVYVDNDCSNPENPMSTWYYCVTSSATPSLSHFVFQFCAFSEINASSILAAGTWSGTPPAATLGSTQTEFTTNGDPQTGAIGLKFDEGFSKDETRGVYFKLDGAFDIGTGPLEGLSIGIKAGSTSETFEGVLEGPCVPTTCAALLPLHITQFEAGVDGNTVMIEWAGHASPEFDHFQIEHSSDGIRFEKIGSVQGISTPDLQSHQFRDLDPSKGINYYRLKMMDVDGSFDYSPVRSVMYDDLNDFMIFPNPSGDLVTLRLPIDVVRGVIMNPLGEIVESFAVTSDQLAIDLSKMSGGLYIVQIVDDAGNQQTKRLLKN